MTAWRRVVLTALCWPAWAVADAPGVGSYDATLCVTVGTQPAKCGPAELAWSGGIAALRIHDFSYQLWVYPSRLSVALMHGNMQVQEFDAPYRWEGSTLLFSDAERGLRYEVRVGAAKP